MTTCLIFLNFLVIAKSSHPTVALVVSIIVNNKDHLPKALSDIGASSSIIIESYISAQFIKTEVEITLIR
jgi:hypothetical protein